MVRLEDICPRQPHWAVPIRMSMLLLVLSGVYAEVRLALIAWSAGLAFRRSLMLSKASEWIRRRIFVEDALTLPLRCGEGSEPKLAVACGLGTRCSAL